MFKPIQHGEILLQPVDQLPKGKVEKHTSFIVGHSETGHHHVVESDIPFDVLVDNDEMWLTL